MKQAICTLFICGLISVYSQVFSQENFAISEIPVELKANARSVVRLDETVTEVYSLTKVKQSRKYVVTMSAEQSITNTEKKLNVFQIVIYWMLVLLADFLYMMIIGLN